MRVAEDLRVEQLGVFADLRLGVQAAAGVVEIHVPGRIEPSVIARP